MLLARYPSPWTCGLTPTFFPTWLSPHTGCSLSLRRLLPDQNRRFSCALILLVFTVCPHGTQGNILQLHFCILLTESLRHIRCEDFAIKSRLLMLQNMVRLVGLPWTMPATTTPAWRLSRSRYKPVVSPLTRRSGAFGMIFLFLKSHIIQ